MTSSSKYMRCDKFEELSAHICNRLCSCVNSNLLSWRGCVFGLGVSMDEYQDSCKSINIDDSNLHKRGT
eukprot:3667058-Amphidinium_carterae.1